MRCLTSAKYTMRATVARAGGATNDEDSGSWVTVQDPDSGAFIRVWKSDTDPGTVVIEGEETFPCMVRGIISGGIRVAGSTQRISDIYENIEWATLQFGTNTVLRKNDRVTKITGRDGTVIWREEEIQGGPATTFLVMGVTPFVSPMGRHTENYALIKRAEVQ